ncbi:MAG: alpha/beta hydrolase [Gammaproteobacteria bacterium]|jgi:hypothetical protein|nr:alpha/beta hydrolase [Gammaproteobacteria bacterium]|tara:strand:+ start:367 stop:1134 length:768 start_codon:yes stop_codon:yes gene_type:complete
MKKSLTSLLTIIVLVYIGFGALLYLFQRSLLYFPTPLVKHSYPEVIFENESEFIHVIVLNEGMDTAVLYFGGNGEAVALNAADFAPLFPSHTVYLVNYRGYGGSSGTPTEDGIYSDALFIFDDVATRHAGVSVIGRSLGSGVATYVGANRSISRLALITPFDSVRNVAQKLYRIYPGSLMLKDHYDSLSRVNQITAPTLVLIAEHDEVINILHTENLVEAFPTSQIRVETISNTGHNTISSVSRYYQLLANHLNR